jgi:predicted membrane-bound dolichyl-phosphate-mannose-protein mannosyltransferase
MKILSILAYELSSLAGLITGVLVVRDNLIYTLAVVAIYLSFRVYFLRAKLEQIRKKLWGDIIHQVLYEPD